MRLNDILSRIEPADVNAFNECMELFDKVAKPLNGLGKLEELLARVAAVSRSADIDISKKAVAVFCADNGVVSQGVTQTGSDVTVSIAHMLRLNKASVSVMAKSCGAEVFPVDIGMAKKVDGLRDQNLMRGTNDITIGSAMNRDIAEKAIVIGINMVKELKDDGFGLIATGEAGIGNTTTSSALASVLLGRSVRDVTGRGAGLDDEGLLRKIAAIEKAIDVNRPDPNDPLDVLHKLGGLDIAALTGLFIGGALHHMPIVLDGFISGAAALLAIRLCPAIKGYILPSHISGEPGARFLMDELDFSPIIHANLHLGEGTGAVALFPLLDMALAVYNDAAKFAEIDVEQYQKIP